MKTLKVLLLLCLFSTSVVSLAQFVDIKINSGNPSFPFPQFLEYQAGKTLAKYNAEGVTHADMEKTMREAYEIMTHRCRYSGGSVDGVPYITFNEKGIGVPDDTQPFCSEGDGYILIAAAMFADQPTFNGLWLWMHDNRLNKVIKYNDCQELRPDQVSGDYMPGWENDASSVANSSETHSASDGDFDMAMGLLIAYKQWGEFMMQDGKQVIDACGNPISYKDAAENFIKALVDTLPNYNNNGGFAGYLSGDIGIDGYVKSGNTWGELTQWRFGQGTYPWATTAPTLGGNYGAHYFDYNAPSYFNEFAYWLENEGNGTPWQINQYKRAEASSDFLIGEAYDQGNIASIGKVFCSTDGTFTFGPFNSGEDFRCSWRTILNYLWHGNPTTSWDPVTHQVVPGGNTHEYDIALRHAEACRSPRLNGAQKCKKMGASPDPGQPNWWGVAQIPQAWGQTGDTELHFAGSNYALGASATAAVATEDLELIADMYRQSELVWDDASAQSSGLTEDERYILSTPKYFHGMFRVLGLLTNSGNLHAPRNMVPAANVKVYMSIDKTYAYLQDNVSYTVQYRNFGSANANGVTITTPLDSDFTFVSANNGGTYSATDHSITWNIGTIPGFKTGGLDATIDSVAFTVKITDIANPRVCLTSTISGNNFENWVSNEYPNRATYTMERNCVDVLANRTLKVSKEANRTEMNPNDIVKFTVNFENESSDDSWMNGGRSNVYLSYGNYLPQFGQAGDWINTSFYQFYRFWHDGAEAYINMHNYRVSYFMNDINKGFKAADNPNGWIFSVDNQNDLDKYDYNPASGPITFAYQKVPAGQDQYGSWNQRIMIRFAEVLTAPATHVYDKLDSDYLLHKGVTGPGFIRSRLYTDPATNMEAKVSDDWSYDPKLQNIDLAAQGSLFFPVTPGWAEYDNPNMAINNFARHSCSPDVDNYDRVLVEEYDGYTWRRIQGRGPLPGKEAYTVVIVDTIPLHLTWKGFVDDVALEKKATYTPAPNGSNYTGIVEWTIDEMLVGESGDLVYEAIATDINCPTGNDVFFENAAWIYSETDSKDSSKVDLMITCTELPPVIDPQTSLFKTANKEIADVGDNISYELEFINTEGTIMVGDLSTQSGWMALANGNIPLATGIFSTNVNGNPGVPAPYFFANEKSYGINGTLETTWDVENNSELYFVFRYASGTPYSGDFNGICLRVTPIPAGQGTIRFEVLDGTTVVATETANVSYPTNADGSFFPINFKIKLLDDKMYIYINDFETVLKTYSGLLTTAAGYVGVYSGPSGNQQKMTAFKTSFDHAFDIKVFDQLPSELGNVTNISAGGTLDGTKNIITWPVIPGPIALHESFTYTYDAEVLACNNYITNLAMATVYGLDTLKVLHSVTCGTTACITPTILSFSTSDDVAICEGGSVTLTASASGPSFIQYEFLLNGSTIQGPSPIATFDATLPGTYTLTVYDDSDYTCFATSANSITITVDPLFTVDLGNDITECSDQTILLDAGNGDSWMWSSGESTQTINPTVSNTYTVTVTRGLCNAEDEIEVDITPIPTVTISPDTDQNLCTNDNLSIATTVPETGNWEYTLYNGVNPDIGPQAAADFVVSTAGTYSVLVTSTDNTTCKNKSTSIDVTIESAATVTLSTPLTQVCDGSAEITASASGTGWQYEFYNAADNLTPVQALSNDDTYEATLSGDYYAMAYKTSNANCNGTSNTLTIELATSPVVSLNASSVLEYCQGSSGSISVTNIAGAGYSWANSSGALVGSGSTYPSASAETYGVTVTKGFCKATVDNIVVSEKPRPEYTLTTSGATNICEGDAFPQIDLTISGTGPFNIVYSDARGLDQTLSGVSSPIVLTPTASTPGLYTFSIINISDQNTSCAAIIDAAETIDVSINQKPIFAFTAPNPVCDNEGNEDVSVYVSTSDPGTFTYSCTGSPGAIDATTGIFDVTAFGKGTYIIDVTLDDNGCVSDPLQQTFMVYESPTAGVSGATEVCAGVQEVLSGTQSGGTAPYSNHKWIQPSSVLTGINTQSPTFQTSTIALYDLSYIVADANGCRDTVAHSVDVVSLPTASINLPPTGFCSSDSAIDLDASFATVSNAGGSYAWSIGATPITQIVPASLGTGTHTLQLVYTYGCEAAPVTENFTIIGSPTATIDDPGLLCTGATTIQLTTSNENPALGTGVWSGTGVDASGMLDISGEGTFNIEYTYTEPNGVCSVLASRSIAVGATPTITFNPIPDGCFNDANFQLSASGTPPGGTGVYSEHVGVSSTGLVTPALLTPGTSYSINYTYTSPTGCKNSASQNYIVHQTAMPAVVANPVTTLVPTPHDPMVALGTADEFRWYDANHDYITSGQSYDPAQTLENTYTYYLTQTLNGCESNFLEVLINVSNCGTPPPTVSNVAICDGDAIPTLSATGSGTINWYSNAGQTVPLLLGSASYTPPTLPAVGSSITYYVSDVNMCEGPAAPITLTVHPRPSISFNLQSEICQEALPLPLSGDPVGGSFTVDAATVSQFDPSPYTDESKNVVYSFTDAGTTCSNSLSKPIFIHATPTPNITSLAASYCTNNGDVILTHDGGAGLSETWSASPAGVSAGVLQPGVFAGTGTSTSITITLNFTDSNGCVATPSPTATTTINDIPKVEANPVEPLCANGSSINLNDYVSPLGGSYGSHPSLSGSIFNPQLAGISDHVISYSYQNPTTLCSASTDLTITVKDSPQLVFDFNGKILCIEDDGMPLSDFVIPNKPPSTTSTAKVFSGGSGAVVDGSPFDFAFYPGIAGAGVHTIDVVYTDEDGCTSGTSANIEVQAVSNPTVTGNTANVQQVNPVVPATYTLTVAGAGGDYHWFTNNLATIPYGNSTSVVPSETSPGIHDYYVYEENANGCKSDIMQVIWHVTTCSTPEPSVSGVQIICEGNDAPVITAIGTGGEYRWLQGSTLLTTGATFTPPISTPRTYNFTLVEYNASENCESNKHSFNIVVNAKPDIQIANNSLEFCIEDNVVHDYGVYDVNGSTGTITNNGADGLLGTGDDFLPSSVTTTNAPIALEFYYEDNITNCKDTVTVAPTVVQLALPGVVSPQTENIQRATGVLTASTNSSGVLHWYNSSMGELSTGTSYVHNPHNQVNTWTYYVREEAGGCFSDPVALEYIIEDCQVSAPDLVQDNPYKICLGESFEPLMAIGEAGANFHWYNFGSTAKTTTNPFKTNKTTVGSSYYIVRQETAACIGDTLLVELEIIDVREPVIALQDDVCEADLPVTLKLRGNYGGTVHWYNDAGLSNEIYTGISFTDPTVDVGLVSWYTVMDSANCSSEPEFMTYTILETPEPPVLTPTAICEDAALAPLTGTAQAGAQVSWINPQGGAPVAGTSFTPQRDDLLLGNVVYFYAQAISNGCESSLDSVAYEYIAKPGIPEVSGSRIMCFESGIVNELPILNAEGTIYWYDAMQNELAGPQQSFELSDVTSVGKYLYHVRRLVGSCYSDFLPIDFHAASIPEPKITGEDSLCEYSNQKLYSVVDGKVSNAESTYSWFITGDRPNYNYGLNEETRYRVVDFIEQGVDTLYAYQEQDGCIGKDSMIIYVAPAPEAFFNAFTPGGPGQVNIYNESIQEPIVEHEMEFAVQVDYFWDFGRENDTTLKQINMDLGGVEKPINLKYDYGTYDITLYARSAFGCEATFTQNNLFVDVSFGLFMPNAFAPNNNSADVREFRPRGFNLLSYEIWIYDKWGNTIWYSNKLTEDGEPAEGWDGRYGDKIMDAGAYIYKCNASYANGKPWKGNKNAFGYTNFGNVYLIK